jgi:hypothetical protein
MGKEGGCHGFRTDFLLTHGDHDHQDVALLLLIWAIFMLGPTALDRWFG